MANTSLTPYQLFFQEPFYKGIRISSYVVCVIIFAGNILTMVTIIKHRWLQTKANAFIFNLCVADLYIGIVSLYFHMTATPEKYKAHVYTTDMLILIVGYLLSVFSLVSVATVRLISIKFPYHYHKVISKVTVTVILITIWITALGLSLVGTTLNYNLGNESKFGHFFVMGIAYTYAVLATCIIGMYISILMAVYKQAKAIQKNLVDMAAKRKFISKVKATFTFGIIVLAYVISWSPITIVFTVDIAKIFPNEITYYRAYVAGELTGFCNSAVNVFIYAWTNSSFRKAYYLTMTCKKVPIACETQLP